MLHFKNSFKIRKKLNVLIDLQSLFRKIKIIDTLQIKKNDIFINHICKH